MILNGVLPLITKLAAFVAVCTPLKQHRDLNGKIAGLSNGIASSNYKSNYLTVEDFINAEKIVLQDIPEDQPDPIATSGKFEGDINLGRSGLINFARIVGSVPGVGKNRILNNAIIGDGRKWPGGRIPYKLSGPFSTFDRSVIASAMNEYSKRTCVTWIPRSNQENYVDFIEDDGCFSSVGRDGGRQTLSLGVGCIQKGIVIHEMMHAVGFFHEQSRTDRDGWVRVNWSNIIPGAEGNFQKLSARQIDSLGVSYDYASVMHYGKTYFSRNGEPTIVPIRNPKAKIGQRYGFSSTDIKKINKFYSCPSTESRGIGGGGTRLRPPSNGCYDNNEHCAIWATHSECQRNPRYMLVNCKRSCKQCSKMSNRGSPACTDSSRFCNYWAARGGCEDDASFMKSNCRRACKVCNLSPPPRATAFRRKDFID